VVVVLGELDFGVQANRRPARGHAVKVGRHRRVGQPPAKVHRQHAVCRQRLDPHHALREVVLRVHAAALVFEEVALGAIVIGGPAVDRDVLRDVGVCGVRGSPLLLSRGFGVDRCAVYQQHGAHAENKHEQEVPYLLCRPLHFLSALIFHFVFTASWGHYFVLGFVIFWRHLHFRPVARGIFRDVRGIFRDVRGIFRDVRGIFRDVWKAAFFFKVY
jgi:hypothetical protein